MASKQVHVDRDVRSLTPLELNGTNFRREFIEVRKATLASILRKSRATGCA